jgi:hypothetical protein
MLIGRLEIAADGLFTLQHFDAETGQPVKLPKFNPRLEFGLLVQQFQSSLVEPSLLADLDKFRALKWEHPRGVVAAVVPVYRACVTEHRLMTRAELVAALEAGAEIAPSDRAAALAALTHAADETIPRI